MTPPEASQPAEAGEAEAARTVPSPVVSIVIVVKSDRRIARLLDAIAALESAPPYELLVIDASRGGLNDIRGSHAGVRWLDFSADDGISIAAQRNAGVRAARGDVIAFVDSDCVPEPDWVSRLVAPILAGGEVVVAGGVRSLEGRSVFDRQWEGQAARYLSEAPTMNLAVHRKVFEQIGGFDESMRFGSDADFTWRVSASGNRIRFAPEAIVGHDWGGLQARLRRAFLYGEARARLHRKHPAARRRLLGPDFVYPAYAAFLAGLPLSLRWRGYPLLLAIPLLKNRRDHPVELVVSNLAAGLGFLREVLEMPLRASERARGWD